MSRNLAPTPDSIDLTGAHLASARLAQIPAARTVSLALAVAVGSRDERDGEHGIAHLLEHLCFRGIEGAPSGLEVAARIEGLGGETNAWTDRETTCYWINVPKPQAAEAAHLLGEIVRRPLLADVALLSERGVVIEEIRGALDDSEERASLALERALWGKSPISREITGSIGEIRRVTPRALRTFHRRHYRPERMSLGIAGDLTRAEANELAALVAPGGGPVALEMPRRVAPAEARGRRIIGSPRDGEQAQLHFGLPGLPHGHPDLPALEILATVLGAGSASRLFVEAREVRGIAYEISAGCDSFSDGGLFTITAGVEPRRIPEASALVRRELRRIAEEPISEQELARARGYIDGAMIRIGEDADEMAEWHALDPLLPGPRREVEAVRADLYRVTIESVSSVARALLEHEPKIGICAPKRAISILREHERDLAV